MKDTRSPSLRLHGEVASLNDGEIDLLDLLRTLWRGRFRILLTALTAVILGGVYAFGVAEPQYRSAAKLTLDVRTKQVLDFESVISGASTELAALNTEIEIILSRRLLGKLTDKLNLTEDPEFNHELIEPSLPASLAQTALDAFAPSYRSAQEDRARNSPRDQVIDNLREALSASVQRNTYVFTLDATTGDPEKSAKIVNTLAGLYVEEQISVKFQANERAVSWLSGRLTELEADLREKENALNTAMSETELISPEVLATLNFQAKDIRERLEEMRDRAENAGATLDRLHALQRSEDRNGMAELTGDAELQRLLPSVRNEEPEAEAIFDQRLGSLLAQQRANHERLRDQSAALSLSYLGLQERIDRQSADLMRIQNMEREAEATRTLYETFLTRQKETTVQRGLHQADSRILSDAISGERVAPRPSLVMALSTMLGALAGAALVLAQQYVHNVFRSAEELEAATRIPVLGQIPVMPIKSRDKLVSYLHERPTSPAVEAIRNLRTSIILSDVDSPPQVIMTTSSLPGEGKTTQAISLAQNLAGLGKKVLLVEGDIRRRTFTEYFHVSPRGGVLTAVSGDIPLNEAVIFDERLGADVLMGENSSVNPADLYSSQRFRDFLSIARESYDFVIIDTPPVLVVPDARVIGQNVDLIAFAVEWNRTTRSQVFAAIREFDSANLSVSGLVLSRVEPKGLKRYGYGDKSGAFSAYGRGYYDAE